MKFAPAAIFKPSGSLNVAAQRLLLISVTWFFKTSHQSYPKTELEWANRLTVRLYNPWFVFYATWSHQCCLRRWKKVISSKFRPSPETQKIELDLNFKWANTTNSQMRLWTSSPMMTWSKSSSKAIWQWSSLPEQLGTFASETRPHQRKL